MTFNSTTRMTACNEELIILTRNIHIITKKGRLRYCCPAARFCFSASRPISPPPGSRNEESRGARTPEVSGPRPSPVARARRARELEKSKSVSRGALSHSCQEPLVCWLLVYSTNRLPNLSLVTPPPPLRNGSWSP